MSHVASTVTLPSGVTLSYAAQGDASGPVVVLLPGPTDSWRSYEPVLAHIRASVRVIAVSLRGHGDSDKPMTGYRVEDLAAEVVALLDGLGVRRAVLVGHSGSCLIARRVAIDHPDRVDGLVLEASPTTLRRHAGLRDFLASIMSNLSDPIDPSFARSLVSDTSTHGVAPDMVDLLVGEVLKVPARVWKEMFSDLSAYDDMDDLDRITVPTLLIWGDADGIVSRDMQSTLAARIRGAELLVYPGLGHTPRWENPVRFAGDLGAFAERTRTSQP